MKILYHVVRIIFGLWFLYAGLAHFLIDGWQPLGDSQAAHAFTVALIDSGVMAIVKVIEAVLGVTMLANRFMPLTIIALVPINVVIVYWNCVLEPYLIGYAFGLYIFSFNAVLAWHWRRYFWPLLTWKGQAEQPMDADAAR